MSTFTDRVKLEEWIAAEGKCRDCYVKIRPGMPFEYHHIIPKNAGGGNELKNCWLVCKPCHSVRTTKTDTPQAAKTKRIIKRAAGIKKSGRPLPGTKASGLRKKMNGEVQRR